MPPRLFCGVYAAVILAASLVVTATAQSVTAPEETQYFHIYKARSEIPYPDFYNIVRALPVSESKIVIFSRGAKYTNEKQDYLGIFGSSISLDGSATSLEPYFKGHGGSWGAQYLDAVWPDGAQTGVLFAAISYDYDGSKPYYAVARFDEDGHLVGKTKKIMKISVRNWADGSWICATVGSDTIGVAMSFFVDDDWGGVHKSEAYFAEFDFNGKMIGDLIPIKIKGGGNDRYVKVFRPGYVNGKWIVPASSYRFDPAGGDVLANELLLAAMKANKGRFKRIENDGQSSGPSFASAQFLAPTNVENEAGGPTTSSLLFVQHRDYLTEQESRDKSYEPEYSTYEISSAGRVQSGPTSIKSEAWDVDFASRYDNTYLSLYFDYVTDAQPLGSNKYILGVLRFTEQMTADKYQFTYETGDMYIGTLDLNKKKIVVEREDLYVDYYFSRLKTTAFRSLMPLKDCESWLLLEGGQESVVQDRHWMDMVVVEKSSVQTRPPDRADHAMAYSDQTEKVLLFGGADGGQYYFDLWEWNGEAWSKLFPKRATPPVKHPKARSRHAMAYDSARGVAVVFGGRNNTRLFGDTWEWDGAGWERVSDSGPAAREGHAMAYADDRGVVILFGGRNGATFYNDVWEWDGKSWEKVSDGEAISPRAEHGMAWDSKRDVAVVFGGTDGTGKRADTWHWNHYQWTLMRDDENRFINPSRRSGAALTYDAKRKAVFLFGGIEDTGYLHRDAYFWNGLTWVRYYGYPITWIPRRTGHAVAFDKKRKLVVLFGGWRPEEVNGETWIWDRKDWFNIMP